MTNTANIFARKNDADNYNLFNEDGTVLTRVDRDWGWPTLWPVNSSLSAEYEHPEGIEISEESYRMIAEIVELDD